MSAVSVLTKYNSLGKKVFKKLFSTVTMKYIPNLSWLPDIFFSELKVLMQGFFDS